MDNSRRVGFRKGSRDLNREADRNPSVQPLRRNRVGKCLAANVLHRNEMIAVGLADVVNRNDVGMVQPRRGLRIAHKTNSALLIPHYIRRQELKSEISPEVHVEMYVIGFVSAF